MNFYKQMMGSFTDSIILPEKLIQKFLPLVGNVTKLIRPSGAMWQVGLIRSGEMLVFEPGWKDFVCANDVLPDDLLVFKYVGGSAFEVSIFDPWGCEKSDGIEETTRVASILRDKSNLSEPEGYVEKLHDMVEGRECSIIARSSENLSSCRKQSDLTSRKRKASGGNIYCEQHGLAMSDNMEVVCNSTSIDFSSMHFCKQMSSLSMHNMSLPVKVRMKLKGIVGKKLQLKRPSGDTWHISLIWSGEELVLQSGWNQFIVANSVSQNDLLVFRFIGGSKFEVLIFDPNGYEKNSNKETRSCWQFFAYGAEPIRSRPENGGEIPREIEVYGNATKGRRTAKEIGVHFPGDEQLAYDRVQGRNPSFLQVLKRSSLTIQCGISIPKKFSADYLPKECQDLVLCCPEKNKTWPVRYFYSQHQQFIRYAGWGKFVNENNLREGDVCSFELIKTLQPITFVVQVSRAS
ncbi:B3 domain-containing protein [Rhynchospora pubera]|uniref:B3 domain-containing protein n=1 Tax=Rhynchospora pubera TaxID=906938 RepID=A0AAV8ETX1_9POAL|nr:B3 domain-containing protein [Rhynchospora pubera]